MKRIAECWAGVMLGAWSCAAAQPCRVEVVEKGTGFPVPMVELRTVHQIRFVTDNAGVIALDAPELMGRETWFHLYGNGYEVPKDGFGYRGVRFTPEPGGRRRIEVSRAIRAQRLGRLTGGGLFAESQKCGERLDWRESGEFGCDTVQTAVFRNRLYWFWGDTSLPKYPLGIFHATGATTPLPDWDALTPPLALPFRHLPARNGDAANPTALARFKGDGPTWIFGTVALKDSAGKDHLGASYIKIKPPLTPYRCGQCEWDEEAGRFRELNTVWDRADDSPEPPVFTDGHPVPWRDDTGTEWLLFGDPFPRLKCPATWEGWQDRTRWQLLNPQRTVTARDGGRQVRVHRGSIAWSGFRRRWVAIFCETHGESSYLGEIWCAEAETPFGPWNDAVKVVSHDNYTFYNPLIHTEGWNPDSPYLYFEGSYTTTFANKAHPTPRYDYTQILYRLPLEKRQDGE